MVRLRQQFCRLKGCECTCQHQSHCVAHIINVKLCTKYYEVPLHHYCCWCQTRDDAAHLEDGVCLVEAPCVHWITGSIQWQRTLLYNGTKQHCTDELDHDIAMRDRKNSLCVYGQQTSRTARQQSHR